MFLKLEVILIIALGLGLLVAMFWLWRMEARLQRFFLGKKGKDLEDTIAVLEDKITALERAQEATSAEAKVMSGKLRKSLRGLETVRFNPFPDQGGNQSFAIGILNEDGDGVVLSSLYARDRMSVFAKPVKAGKSEYELSDEEREALERARV